VREGHFRTMTRRQQFPRLCGLHGTVQSKVAFRLDQPECVAVNLVSACPGLGGAATAQAGAAPETGGIIVPGPWAGSAADTTPARERSPRHLWTLQLPAPARRW
jgi:hypothetical protein